MKKYYLFSVLILVYSSCKKGVTTFSNDRDYEASNSLTYSYNGSAFYVPANCSDSIVFDTTINAPDTDRQCYFISATDGITHLEIEIVSNTLKNGIYDLPAQGNISIYKYDKSKIIGYPGSFQLEISKSDGKSVSGSFSGQLWNVLDGGVYPISGDFSNIAIKSYYTIN